MSVKKPVNLDASVRSRLLNISRERSEDFNLVLTTAMDQVSHECFLYLISPC